MMPVVSAEEQTNHVQRGLEQFHIVRTERNQLRADLSETQSRLNDTLSALEHYKFEYEKAFQERDHYRNAYTRALAQLEGLARFAADCYANIHRAPFAAVDDAVAQSVRAAATAEDHDRAIEADPQLKRLASKLGAGFGDNGGVTDADRI